MKTFDININSAQLKGFVDAAHANDLRKRCSTTGLVFTFMGGPVVYQSRTQTVTAGSSTEAKFFAAYSLVKLLGIYKPFYSNSDLSNKDGL